MQILFDVRTVALFIALTFVAQATAIGAQAFLIRELRQYRGVVAALVANLSMAAGVILRLFGDQFPDLIDILLADGLLLMGPGLYYIALGQFTGLSYSKRLVAAVIGGIVALLAYFTYWENQVGTRITILSLGVFALVSLFIYQLWRMRSTHLRFSANLMLVSFVIYGLFLIGRTINVALDPPSHPFSNTPVQSATYLLSFAISFFWSTGFILMVSQRLKNDLTELATTDLLTRIPNRRAMQAYLEKELSRAQRSDGQFAVLLIDIDDFKRVNDRWGHSVGDAVLTETAAVFQSMLRKQDMVGRWGGEEFLLISPGSPHCDPEALAERVRHDIAALEYRQGDVPFHITVSIGVVCADQKSSIDGILKDADLALYRAKRTKNAVCMAKEK